MIVSPRILALALLPLLSVSVRAQTAREALTQLAGDQPAQQIPAPLSQPVLSADCFTGNLGRPGELDRCLADAFANAKDVLSVAELRLEKSWDCRQKVTADQKFFSFNTDYPLTNEIKFSGTSGVLTVKMIKGIQSGYHGVNSPEAILFSNGELMDNSIPQQRMAFPFGISSVYRLDPLGNLISESIAGPAIVLNGRPDF